MSEDRAAAADSAELRRLRQKIDRLDRRIVALLNERAELAKAVGHEKLRIGRVALGIAREIGGVGARHAHALGCI